MAAFSIGRWCIPLRCHCWSQGSRSGKPLVSSRRESGGSPPRTTRSLYFTATYWKKHNNFLKLLRTGQRATAATRKRLTEAGVEAGPTPRRGLHPPKPGRAVPRRLAGQKRRSGRGSPRGSVGVHAWGCAPLPPGPRAGPRAEPSGAGPRRRRLPW